MEYDYIASEVRSTLWEKEDEADAVREFVGFMVAKLMENSLLSEEDVYDMLGSLS